MAHRLHRTSNYAQIKTKKTIGLAEASVGFEHDVNRVVAGVGLVSPGCAVRLELTNPALWRRCRKLDEVIRNCLTSHIAPNNFF